MPIVQVSVWEGMSLENKKKTVEGITKVFVDLGFLRKQLRSSFMKRQRAIGQQVDNYIQKATLARPRYKELHSLSQKARRAVDDVSANFSEGVLEITLPKKAPKQKRKVAVK